MDSFLSLTAKALYDKYGDEISSLNIILPNRRARIFFTDALSAIAQRPLWQPSYVTMDQLAEDISGLRHGDEIRLITELYKIFREYHDEPFDTFYFWGERLLADFDSLDQYMVDAGMLFRNISDLKEIENDHSYLTPEQRQAITRFWSTFGPENNFSEEKRRFADVWNTLLPVYNKFRDRLSSENIGYGGMIYRRAAELLIEGKIDEADRRHYAVIGFNALSKCEKKIFDYLKTVHETCFFWDSDPYYIESADQEAGMFLRENMKRYPQHLKLPESARHLTDSKRVRIVKTPGDSLQTRYVGSYLSEIIDKNGCAGKETAVVLADENLLTAVLNAIPAEIGKINVTMGFPLRQTLFYSFTERVIELRMRRRETNGGIRYYHNDVTGILRHPFIVRRYGPEAGRVADEIISRQQVYIPGDKLESSGISPYIFAARSDEGWETFSFYLEDVVSGLTEDLSGPEGREKMSAEEIEFAAIILDNIRKLRNSLNNCGVDISTATFASLLRRLLQNTRVPYEGEPLEGVQVMGILETRCLDFENVIILSLNDDIYPGNLLSAPSFIPYSLKVAYGLPTTTNHEAIFAYYFYRLLQKAGSADLVYSEAGDELGSGEPSRFLHQLTYESPLDIERRDITLDVSVPASGTLSIEKKGEIAERLMAYMSPNGPALTPTTVFNYIQCPLKFYFHSIAGLAPEEEIVENVDAPMFGTILHRALELLYSPLRGKTDPRGDISKLAGSEQVNQAVATAIREKFFKGEYVDESDYGGNIVLINHIITRYLNNCIIPYDSQGEPFTIVELEKRITGSFCFKAADGLEKKVNFKGFVDRIDLLENGCVRIVDYKTGADHREFKGMEALFSNNYADLNSAVFQSFIYSMLVKNEGGKSIIPCLYYIRQLNRPGYSPLIQDKSRNNPIISYTGHSEEFESRLGALLKEMFDTDKPFIQCTDTKPCVWCNFRVICRK